MIRTSLRNFKYSFLLFVGIFLSLFIYYRYDFVKQLILFFSNLNYFFFILSGISGFLGAISFSFPYFVIIKKLKIKVKTKKFIGLINDFVFFDCLGNDPYKFIERKLKLPGNINKIVRSSDLVALIIITIISLFFISKPSLRLFFLITLVVLTIFILWRIMTFIKNFHPDRKLFFNLIIAAFIRYIFELPRTLFIFYAIGLFLPLPVIIIFLSTSSVLYSVPKFKSTGGLLALYLMILSPFIGISPLYGFLVAVLFRISAILFYILPVYMYKILK